MDQEALLKLFYDEYRRELDEVDSLYRRGGILISAQVVIATVILALCNGGLVKLFGTRFDISLYTIGIVSSLVLLGSGVFDVLLALRPSSYQVLSSLSEWSTWRRNYANMLANSPQVEADAVPQLVDQATADGMLQRVSEARDANSESTRLRLSHYERAFRHTSFALVASALVAVTYCWLKLAGVTP